MAERLAVFQLVPLAAVARLRAEQAAAAARAALQHAATEVQRADAATADAVQAWSDHLAVPAFLPELAHALGDVVIARAETRAEAETRRQTAEAEAARCDATLQTATARARVIAKLAKRDARLGARRDEARAADAFETLFLARSFAP